eukprot:TRINITY_DN7439_c0_g1_i1.p1 TRINITY_DN7439_c0_g1~~TRINITY_DN7439_c0_g1_i1.p1  ORF type:complete len:317 (-),score=57.83 TRINITY_DN7439_c0_g1_i1:5-859(-)
MFKDGDWNSMVIDLKCVLEGDIQIKLFHHASSQLIIPKILPSFLSGGPITAKAALLSLSLFPLIPLGRVTFHTSFLLEKYANPGGDYRNDIISEEKSADGQPRYIIQFGRSEFDSPYAGPIPAQYYHPKFSIELEIEKISEPRVAFTEGRRFSNEEEERKASWRPRKSSNGQQTLQHTKSRNGMTNPRSATVRRESMRGGRGRGRGRGRGHCDRIGSSRDSPPPLAVCRSAPVTLTSNSTPNPSSIPPSLPSSLGSASAVISAIPNPSFTLPASGSNPVPRTLR